jgi:hypothetical protein
MAKEQQKQQSSTIQLPDWITQASQLLVQKGVDFANKPFQKYTGQMVANLTPDQQTAFQRLRSMVRNSPVVLQDALSGARSFAQAPAQNVQTERVVDETGRLGAIKDYMNPHVDAALAPALRKIQEAADVQRNRLGASATMSGAFGDARHGIVESALNRETSTAVGDTAAKFYSDAYDKAMANRFADLNRFLQTDTANAGYNERQLDRLFAGSGALIDRATADQARQLQGLQALLAGGTVQQQNQQAKLDAAYREFLRQYGHDANVVNVLAAALRGAPFGYTQTTTTREPDNTWLQLIGALAGRMPPTQSSSQ